MSALTDLPSELSPLFNLDARNTWKGLDAWDLS